MRARDGLAAVAVLVMLWAIDARAQTAPGEPGRLPAGHPPVDRAAAHGGGKTIATPGVFTPPEDTETDDPSSPAGTITVELRDADDHPVPGEQVTLGILINSIAKGDRRDRLQATTDAQGRAVFRDLQTESNIAYRVSSGHQGGSFAAMPFQLQQAKATRVVLHVYPVVHDVQQAVIVEEATLAAELRDDRIQVEEVLTVYNLGRTAWQPMDVQLKLPPSATAFAAQTTMSDQGVDESGGSGRLRGTFPPGRHAVEFRWQLPWADTQDVDFQVGLPPHVAIARVMMPAAGGIKLAVQGFPSAEAKRDTQGQSFLVTEKRLRPEEPRLVALDVRIHDLPTVGPARWVATALAAFGVLVGLAMTVSRRGRSRSVPEDARSARSAVLEELAELERGRSSGEVGPKTYERARRELIDALARTLAET